MSQGPPTYPHKTKAAFTMNETMYEKDNASVRRNGVWSELQVRKHNIEQDGSAQILGTTGTIQGKQTVDKSSTGIEQKYGDNTIKATGAINAAERIDNSSTGIVTVEGATGSARITENTGNIAAKHVKGISTGITYSR